MDTAIDDGPIDEDERDSDEETHGGDCRTGDRAGRVMGRHDAALS